MVTHLPQQPSLSCPCRMSVKLTPKASGLLQKETVGISLETLPYTARGPEERPLLPYSPRRREGPSLRPISKSPFSLSPLLSSAAPDRRDRPALPAAHFRSPQLRGAPRPAAPLVFQSNPPLGCQPASAEPMPTLLLPPHRGSAANQNPPRCRVPSAIVTGDACLSVAIVTRERAASSPKAASWREMVLTGGFAGTSPRSRATCLCCFPKRCGFF